MYPKSLVVASLLFVTFVVSSEPSYPGTLPKSLYNYAQQALAYVGREADENVTLSYLKQSISSELSKRLSTLAQVVVHGGEDFESVNARYTDYLRPGYIAGVKVAEEKDVVETVRLFPIVYGLEFDFPRLIMPAQEAFHLSHGPGVML